MATIFDAPIKRKANLGGGVIVSIDDAKLNRMIRSSEERANKRIGSWIRIAARRGIKTRKRYKGRKGKKRNNVSKPGTPPFNHADRKSAGLATLKAIYYELDRSRHSVVVGPIILRNRNQDFYGGIPAPKLLEEGGTAARVSLKGKRFTVRHPKRPYMKPALDRGISTGAIADFWRGTIKRAG